MPSLALALRTAAGLSGAENIVLEHAARFAAAGWTVRLFAERLDATRLRARGIVPARVLGWPWGGRLKRRLFDLQVARALRRAPAELVCGHGDTLRQDVLFLHNCVRAAHEAVHGGPPPADSGPLWMHERILAERGFRLLVANSRLMRAELLDRYGLPAGLVEVVHPGYDPRRFRREDRPGVGAALRRELSIAAGAPLVGVVTSGDFRKRGVPLFFEALARLSPSLRAALHVLVIGSERRLAPYLRMAAAAGLGERVRFLPPEPRVERFYHALDVLCYPALYEEFGMCVLEALACGTPLLASRRVGACELLEGTVYEAFLPERPAAERLAADLDRLLGDADLRSALSNTGPAAVRGSDWDAHFEKTRRLFENVLAQKKTGA